jgi:hypothetical protein
MWKKFLSINLPSGVPQLVIVSSVDNVQRIFWVVFSLDLTMIPSEWSNYLTTVMWKGFTYLARALVPRIQGHSKKNILNSIWNVMFSFRTFCILQCIVFSVLYLKLMQVSCVQCACLLSNRCVECWQCIRHTWPEFVGRYWTVSIGSLNIPKRRNWMQSSLRIAFTLSWLARCFK